MALGNFLFRKCDEARHEARLWAEKNPNATTEEILAEALSRYYYFIERKAFLQEAMFLIRFTRTFTDTAE